MAERFGADVITAHLREDRRHISDLDIERLIEGINVPLNLEMAATEEMVSIALKIRPNAACIVPERRKELTTEGGLAVIPQEEELKKLLSPLKNAGIRLSLFIEANKVDIDAAKRIGADIVELHTGRYCYNRCDRNAELLRIKSAASYTSKLGIETHAGHGLCFETVSAIAAIPEMEELNIGHFLIGESVFCGLGSAIKKMRKQIDTARRQEKTDL